MQTPQYIWQHAHWQNFHFDSAALLQPLASVRKAQGRLLGLIEDLRLDDSMRVQAVSLEEDVIQTAAIEGEALDRESVRSSIARHLGLPHAGLRPADRAADGLVQILLDATRNYTSPLTAERLYGWHAALFPTGYSGLHKITVAGWRTSPMQVVSGPVGKQTVHYEAPSPEMLDDEMRLFFHWWEKGLDSMDGIIRAALAHFYFVTIHPFDDGNGRLARCIADMALAQDEKTGMRFYSLSAQMMAERESYYEVLERTQKGSGDTTLWLLWFFGCLERAIIAAASTLNRVLFKAGFWKRHSDTPLSERQRKVLNRLLDAGPDGFEGGLSTRKYMGMAKTSRATAWREIEDLLKKGLLQPLPGGGRSTAYTIAWEPGILIHAAKSGNSPARPSSKKPH
ncbi:Fic family protein [Desulfococcaceae bacterium OttesenSCG-928-F15]|nr:Fic family protein [Desulfococcaceae bacterium OttesenSCG-928-F15]